MLTSFLSLPHPLARSPPEGCARRRSLAGLRHFRGAKNAPAKRLGPWALAPHPGPRAKTGRRYAAAGKAPQLFCLHYNFFFLRAPRPSWGVSLEKPEFLVVRCYTKATIEFLKNFFRPEKKLGPQFPQFFFFFVARSREKTAINGIRFKTASPRNRKITP